MDVLQSFNIQSLYNEISNPKFPDSRELKRQPESSPNPVDLSKQAAVKEKNQQEQVKNPEKSLPDILKDMEKKINQMQEIGLTFSQYKDSGKMIVRVVEKGSHKVIREIPSEEFMELVEKMDQMIGILFNKKI